MLNPTDTLTFADLNVGIPNLLTCIEMVPLSLFFLFAYSWNPYLLRNQPSDSAGYQGVGGALIAMVNPKDIINAIVFAFRMDSEHRQFSKSRAPGYAGSSEYALLEDQYQNRAI